MCESCESEQCVKAVKVNCVKVKCVKAVEVKMVFVWGVNANKTWIIVDRAIIVQIIATI